MALSLEKTLEDVRIAIEALSAAQAAQAATEDTTGIVLAAGAATIGNVETNAKRNAGILHRSAITTADKLAVPALPTLADRSAAGGALLANSSYKVAVAAVRLGIGSSVINGFTTPSAVATLTTANDGNNAHQVRVTIAQVTNAQGYLIFLSTDAAPKLVGYITEAQRASGIQLNAVFTTSAGGAAGAVDIGIAGTGLQTTDATFAYNTAHTPALVAAPIDCTGRNRALIHVRPRLSKTASWTVTPSLVLIPWIKSQEASPNADWFACDIITPTFLASAAGSMEQVYTLELNGATGLVVTLSSIAGLESVDVWVELA